MTIGNDKIEAPENLLAECDGNFERDSTMILLDQICKKPPHDKMTFGMAMGVLYVARLHYEHNPECGEMIDKVVEVLRNVRSDLGIPLPEGEEVDG